MAHDEFLEEYLSICAAVFNGMRRSGQLDMLEERPEETRTTDGLEINEMLETEFGGRNGSNSQT